MFSTQTTALDLIEDMLSWKGWDDVFLRMDGNTSSDERGQLITRFNDKSECVILNAIHDEALLTMKQPVRSPQTRCGCVVCIDMCLLMG